MKIQKTKLIGFLIVMAGLRAQAQVKFPVTNNDLRNNLEKIIADYPNQFSSLKGDTLEVNPQSIEFSSRLDFKMAPQNAITQYNSLKPVYSWHASFLNTEEFEEASKKYKWLCGQLKVMTIKLDGGYSFTLSGDFNAPDDAKKYTSTVYKLTPGASHLPKLKIEATMEFVFPEWKVNLVVYEKEREDHERGNVTGD